MSRPLAQLVLIPRLSMTVAKREAGIHAAFRELIGAADLAGRYAAWRTMRDLILGRSPAEVSRREQLLGLDRRR